MIRIIVPSFVCLGGTTEGKIIAKSALPIIYTTTTQLGADQIPCRDQLVKLVGPLTYEELVALFSHPYVVGVIDATHPFATSISQSAYKAALSARIPYVRFQRELPVVYDVPWITYVADESKAAQLLALQYPNSTIFLSTGAYRLEPYKHEGVLKRSWVRIIPQEISRIKALEAGVALHRIVEGLGPFSVDENIEHFSRARAHVLVTKESGFFGGYEEKLIAARKLQMQCVVLKQPRFNHPECIRMTEEEIIAWAQMLLTKYQSSGNA